MFFCKAGLRSNFYVSHYRINFSAHKQSRKISKPLDISDQMSGPLQLCLWATRQVFESQNVIFFFYSNPIFLGGP